MNVDERISKVLSSVYEIITCGNCGTRIRFGDMECPHCGLDLDNELLAWTERLLDKLG